MSHTAKMLHSHVITQVYTPMLCILLIWMNFSITHCLQGCWSVSIFGKALYPFTALRVPTGFVVMSLPSDLSNQSDTFHRSSLLLGTVCHVRLLGKRRRRWRRHFYDFIVTSKVSWNWDTYKPRTSLQRPWWKCIPTFHQLPCHLL